MPSNLMLTKAVFVTAFALASSSKACDEQRVLFVEVAIHDRPLIDITPLCRPVLSQHASQLSY